MTKIYRKQASYCISGEKKKNPLVRPQIRHTITTENPLQRHLKYFSTKILGGGKLKVH